MDYYIYSKYNKNMCYISVLYNYKTNIKIISINDINNYDINSYEIYYKKNCLK